MVDCKTDHEPTKRPHISPLRTSHRASFLSCLDKLYLEISQTCCMESALSTSLFNESIIWSKIPRGPLLYYQITAPSTKNREFWLCRCPQCQLRRHWRRQNLSKRQPLAQSVSQWHRDSCQLSVSASSSVGHHRQFASWKESSLKTHAQFVWPHGDAAVILNRKSSDSYDR